MKSGGTILMVAGAAIAILAFFLDTSVATYSSFGQGEVVNLAKLQAQTLLFCGGGALFLAGVVFVGAGHVAETLERIGGRMHNEGSADAPAGRDGASEPIAGEPIHEIDEEQAARDRQLTITVFSIVGALILILLVLALAT